MRNINRAIFVLSLIGFFVSTFLAYEYSQKGPITCPITGSGCDLVRKSSYSNFAGIDLPVFGLMFYFTLAFLTIFLTQKFDKLVNRVRILLAFSGFAFGVYLTYLEAFVIKGWCFWCLSSFVVSILIFLLCLMKQKS